MAVKALAWITYFWKMLEGYLQRLLRPAGKAAKVCDPVECPLQWRLMLHTSDGPASVEFGCFRLEPHRRERPCQDNRMAGKRGCG